MSAVRIQPNDTLRNRKAQLLYLQVTVIPVCLFVTWRFCFCFLFPFFVCRSSTLLFVCRSTVPSIYTLTSALIPLIRDQGFLVQMKKCIHNFGDVWWTEALFHEKNKFHCDYLVTPKPCAMWDRITHKYAIQLGCRIEVSVGLHRHNTTFSLHFCELHHWGA